MTKFKLFSDEDQLRMDLDMVWFSSGRKRWIQFQPDFRQCVALMKCRMTLGVSHLNAIKNIWVVHNDTAKLEECRQALARGSNDPEILATLRRTVCTEADFAANPPPPVQKRSRRRSRRKKPT